MSWIAIGCFIGIICLTLVITYFAARRTQTTADFYVAGGNIGGVQNGLAIAGDFMSAATLLGTTAMIYNAGFDAAIYLAASPMAFVIFLFLMTDKLRELGRFTFVEHTGDQARRKAHPNSRSGNFAGVGVDVPYGSGRGSGRTHPDTVRYRLCLCSDDCERAHGDLCIRGWHVGDHLGADHQGDPVTRWDNHAGFVNTGAVRF